MPPRTTGQDTEIKVKFVTKIQNLTVPSREIAISINRKWLEVMQENHILFNNRNHELVKGIRSGTRLDVGDRIDGFYRSFKKNQTTYKVYIRTRATPSAVTPQRVSRRVGHHTLPNLTPLTASTSNPTATTPLLHQTQNSPGVNVTRTPVGGTPHYSPRDEDTHQGNVVATGELNIRDRVVPQFSRISNNDMLTIWRELKSVRDGVGFNSLIRMIPFTSGILRNIFLDKLLNLESSQ